MAQIVHREYPEILSLVCWDLGYIQKDSYKVFTQCIYFCVGVYGIADFLQCSSAENISLDSDYPHLFLSICVSQQVSLSTCVLPITIRCLIIIKRHYPDSIL